MADPLPWPAVLVPSSEDWSLRGGSRSGGQTVQGQEQIVASPTARWKASLTIPCFTPDHIRAMRRVIALGRTQAWLVGPREVTRAPWPIEPVLGGRITYATPGVQQPALAFSLSVAAVMNATAITLRRDAGDTLAPGMIFSIGQHLHVITAITSADPFDLDSGLAAAGTIDVQIRPWLRADHAAGDAVEFGRPLGTMRLATDDTGAMDLRLSRLGTVTLDLVETF